MLSSVINKFTRTGSQEVLNKPSGFVPVNTLERAFVNEDLKHHPEEWMPKLPDFVGVGAAKSGTSWWYRLLIEHPQINEHLLYSEERATSKELHYLDHFVDAEFSQKALDAYKNAFSAPEGMLCGEVSTTYLSSPACLELLAKIAPETKIIVMLRNPIDRALSHINHVVQNRGRRFGLTGSSANLFKIYSVFPEASLLSLYGYALKRLVRLFKREQVLVLQYESCKKNTLKEIERTYRFLGVDSNFVPSSIDKVINELPYIINKDNNVQREYLKDYFVDDVYLLNSLFPDLDYSLWPEFSVD